MDRALEAPQNSYVAATRPWAFTDTAGRRHEARLLGAGTCLKWIEIFAWAENDPWRMVHTMNRFIRVAYPPKFRYWLTVRPRHGRLVGLAVLALTILHAVTWRTTATVIGLRPSWWLGAALAAATAWLWCARGQPDPVAEFLRLDAAKQGAAIKDFFHHAGFNIPLPRIPTRTTSKRSAAASPPRPKGPSTAAG